MSSAGSSSLQSVHRKSPAGRLFIQAIEAAVQVPSSSPGPVPIPLLPGLPAPYSDSATFTFCACANVIIQSRTIGPEDDETLWAIAHVEVCPALLYCVMFA